MNDSMQVIGAMIACASLTVTRKQTTFSTPLKSAVLGNWKEL